MSGESQFFLKPATTVSEPYQVIPVTGILLWIIVASVEQKICEGVIAFYEVWAFGAYIYITGDHCNRGSAPYSEVSVQ
jgi:hypothetical protein